MKERTFRRRYRFGVRTLLLLVLVVAIWLGIQANKVHRQRKAVNVIGQSGSFVYYHEFSHRTVGSVDYSAEPSGPAWLRKVVGDDFFQSVRIVTLSPTDDAMKHLASLPDVDFVALDAYQLTDVGFGRLSSIKNLKKLTIENGHNLSNISMATLAELPSLRRVIMYNTPIDHRSLDHLAKLTNLRELFLGGTRLTDEDVTRLRALLPDTMINVNLEMPPYQRPAGILRPMNRPYNEYKGTSLDPRGRR